MPSAVYGAHAGHFAVHFDLDETAIQQRRDDDGAFAFHRLGVRGIHILVLHFHVPTSLASCSCILPGVPAAMHGLHVFRRSSRAGAAFRLAAAASRRSWPNRRRIRVRDSSAKPQAASRRQQVIFVFMVMSPGVQW